MLGEIRELQSVEAIAIKSRKEGLNAGEAWEKARMQIKSDRKQKGGDCINENA